MAPLLVSSSPSSAALERHAFRRDARLAGETLKTIAERHGARKRLERRSRDDTAQRWGMPLSCIRVLTKICMVRSVLSRAPAEEGSRLRVGRRKVDEQQLLKSGACWAKYWRLIIRSCAFEIRANMNENIVMKFTLF